MATNHKGVLWSGALVAEAARLAGVDKEEAAIVIDAFLRVLSGRLADGLAVGLHRVGSLHLRTVRNPRTGRKVRMVEFRPVETLMHRQCLYNFWKTK